MKKIIISCLVTAMTMGSMAQNVKIDREAVLLLDRMSAVIGDLHSCSFTVKASIDTIDKELGLLKYFNTSEVSMVGPDKMQVTTNGYRGHRGFWYNGKQLAYYSFTENNFGFIDAPGTIMETIEAVHEDYDIDFPAADFFFPYFTDDLIESSDVVSFLGKTFVDGRDCYHIAAKNKEMSVQIWIADDAFNLPVKFAITYYRGDHSSQYEGSFSNWKLNPELPNAMFEFTAPPGATQLTIISKKGN